MREGKFAFTEHRSLRDVADRGAAVVLTGDRFAEGFSYEWDEPFSQDSLDLLDAFALDLASYKWHLLKEMDFEVVVKIY